MLLVWLPGLLYLFYVKGLIPVKEESRYVADETI